MRVLLRSICNDACISVYRLWIVDNDKEDFYPISKKVTELILGHFYIAASVVGPSSLSKVRSPRYMAERKVS
jgi:hypothetical protein